MKRFVTIVTLLFVFLSPSKAQNKRWQSLGPIDSSANNPTPYAITTGDMCIVGADVYIAFADSTINKRLAVRKFSGGYWMDVGAKGLSVGEPYALRIEADAAGNIFLSYMDIGKSYELQVKKLSGNTWVDVNSTYFSTFAVVGPSLTVHNGEPYVLFGDGYNSYSGKIVKHNGTSWVNVGTVTAFSMPYAEFSDIQVGSNGTVYILYSNDNHYNLSLKKYDGSTWTDLPAFDPTNLSGSKAPDLALDKNNNPHVLFADYNNGEKASLKKFDGTTWLALAPPLSAVAASGFNLVFDNDTCYAGFSNGGNPYNGYTVKKFDKQVWTDLGLAPASYMVSSLAIQAHTPVMFHNGGWYQRGVVAKYENSFWKSIDAKGLAAGTSYLINTAIDTAGIPYVAYPDWLNNGKPAVKKYVSGSWQNVSVQGLSDTTVGYFMQMHIAKDNQLYIAFVDFSSNMKITVKKFDGNVWNTIGTKGFSANRVDDFSLCVDNNGTPYVSYLESTIIMTQQVRVMKFDGNAWVSVGGLASDDWSYGSSMALDNNGTPYVAFQYVYGGYGLGVRKFNGTNWVHEGNPGADLFGAPSIAIDQANNSIYTSYIDDVTGNVTVKKFNGTSWSTIGYPSTTAIATDMFMYVDAGIPYVSYTDAVLLNVPRVKKLDGSTWKDLATNQLSGTGTSMVQLALRNGKVIAGYANHDCYVKELVEPASVSDINFTRQLNIYPNPVNDFLIVESLNGTVPFAIYNTAGMVVKQGMVTGRMSIDVRAFSPGVYYLQTTQGSGKFIVTH